MNNIKQYRTAAGLSMSELAEECGWTSASRIANYESGHRLPRLSDIRKILKALANHHVECEVDDLFPPEIEVA